MTRVRWEKKCAPLDYIKRERFLLVKMMKTHIKYCPVNNPEEIHIISKSAFMKDFKQSVED